jgi:uncharacterized protein (TIGR03435 family)
LVLTANAYHVKVFQILGGPSWMNSDLYKIEAKAAGNASQDALLLALQTLLEDRFGLRIERTTKELPVYVLSLGKGGVKRQQPNAGACNAPDEPPTPTSGTLPCGHIMMMVSPVRTQLEGRGVSVAQLIERLSYFVDRPIIDRTGYAGTLNIKLEFAPDRDAFGLFADAAPGQPLAPDDNIGTSFSTAIRDQLGLKLASAKGPIHVISVRHVERPSPN